MKLLANLAISAFALTVVAHITPGFQFDSTMAVIISTIVLGTINTFIKPIIQIIAIPITILTFGVAAFLINVLFLWLTSKLVPGFGIDGFFTAIIASLVLTLVSWFLHRLEKMGD